MTDIKQIRSYTLSGSDKDCRTYKMTTKFLSEVLPNERNGHFHYVNRSMKIIGRTLILFKYKGELIGKGIFTEKVEDEEECVGTLYPGYYQVEEGSIQIFKRPIDLDMINSYFEVKSLSRDQIFDLKYLDEINKMIEDYTE